MLIMGLKKTGGYIEKDRWHIEKYRKTGDTLWNDFELWAKRLWFVSETRQDNFDIEWLGGKSTFASQEFRVTPELAWSRSR
jgi:hypothetical protein